MENDDEDEEVQRDGRDGEEIIEPTSRRDSSGTCAFCDGGRRGRSQAGDSSLRDSIPTCQLALRGLTRAMEKLGAPYRIEALTRRFSVCSLGELVHALVRQSKQSGGITGARLQASSAQDTHGSTSLMGDTPFFVDGRLRSVTYVRSARAALAENFTASTIFARMRRGRRDPWLPQCDGGPGQPCVDACDSRVHAPDATTADYLVHRRRDRSSRSLQPSSEARLSRESSGGGLRCLRPRVRVASLRIDRLNAAMRSTKPGFQEAQEPKSLEGLGQPE